MNKIYFSFLVILFFSCTTQSKISYPRISYLGNSYAPTKEADIYVDEKSIERPYKVIGKGYPDWGWGGSSFSFRAVELLQQKVLETAKTRGADAVLIQDYYILNNNPGINSFYRTDSAGRGLVTMGNSTYSNTPARSFLILFLKYKDQ